MGMFDELTCLHPLPLPGMEGKLFQTKSTPNQYLDHYQIRQDGTLWHEAYEIEDRSDPSKKGLAGMVGCMTRVNKRWEPVPDFTGEIRFYDFQGTDFTGWVEFSAYFVAGKISQPVQVIRNDPPDPAKRLTELAAALNENQAP